MSNLKNKISHLINSQVPDFVLSDHPKFLEFLKVYYTFMESAQISLTNIQTSDGIILEAESTVTFNLLLNGTGIETDRTITNSGEKILLEDSTVGKFERGEIIQGQISKAQATILAEDLTNSRLYISSQNKFLQDEIIIGLTSGATANISDYRPNPVTSIQELLDFRDPDKVISNFLKQFRKELLATIPETLDNSVNKRTLLKNIKSLYKLKGTNIGNKIFFKLLFDLESETSYPREQILRLSDGKWNTDNILRIVTTQGNPLELIGRTILGITSNATAIVENAVAFQIGADFITQFTINPLTTSGVFQIGEEVRGTKLNDDLNFIKGTVTGIPEQPSVTSAGNLYSENTVVDITGGGTGALIQIENIGRSGLSNIFVENGGTNYSLDDDIVFNNANTSGGAAIAKVSVVNGGFTLEESISLVDDHIILEDETNKGDLYTGNKIVQEVGSGVRDITDIRIINSGFNYVNLPTCTVNSLLGNGASIKSYGNDIGKVLSLKVIEPGKGYQNSPALSLILPTNIFFLNRTGSFVVGEDVSGLSIDNSTIITGRVRAVNNGINVLYLNPVLGLFKKGTTITGLTSGATATVFEYNNATATSNVVAVSKNFGNYINQDGHISENTIKIQDSLLYQDFSYIIKIGRTINNWRDSFKKTMHSAGFYFISTLNIESKLNARISSPVAGITSGIVDTPIYSVLNTLFATIFGRRLGTTSDGTTLRTNAKLGVPADFNPATIEHFPSNTRDLTLTSKSQFLFELKENTNIRNNKTRFGRALSIDLKSLNNLLLDQNFSTQIKLEQLNTVTVIGTKNEDIDGELLQMGDFLFKDKTYFTIPSEITRFLSTGSDTFDETNNTFDNTNITIDATPVPNPGP
jgi:hypothetical protein